MEKTNNRPGSRALRKGRVSIAGQWYLVTATCHERCRWFEDWGRACAASVALSELRLWRDSHLRCWVLMPDHFHALVELGGREPLSRLMQRVKAVTARAVKLAAPQTGRVWMPGFHDRALRREERAIDVARYVIGNPLRAKLAAVPGDYPYWDACWLEGDDSIP